MVYWLVVTATLPAPPLTTRASVPAKPANVLCKAARSAGSCAPVSCTFTTPASARVGALSANTLVALSVNVSVWPPSAKFGSAPMADSCAAVTVPPAFSVTLPISAALLASEAALVTRLAALSTTSSVKARLLLKVNSPT